MAIQLFKSLDTYNQGHISKQELLETLKDNGILSNDWRVPSILNSLKNLSNTKKITLNKFEKLIEHKVYKNPVDRWENTPLEDAYRHKFLQVINLLK